MAFNNFPYTNFQDLNLDWIMRNVKTALLNSSDAVETANNLKNFVETYFDNLDVQQEINNKIDEMVESGEFLDAIDDFITNTTSSYIGQWLEDNITPTTPIVDASLTINGAAADAKVTGDEIRNLDSVLNKAVNYSRQFLHSNNATTGYYYNISSGGTLVRGGGGTNSATIYEPIHLKADKTYYFRYLYGYFCIIDDGTSLTRLSDNQTTGYSGSFTPQSDCVIYITTADIPYNPKLFADAPIGWSVTQDDTVYDTSLGIDEFIHIKISLSGDYDAQSPIFAVRNLIHDASPTRQYMLDVYPGTYNLQDAITETEQQGNIWGLKLPDYVHMRGIGNRDEIIINCSLPNGAPTTNVERTSVLNISGNNTLENLTFTGTNVRYVVHDESSNTIQNWKRIVKNCKFVHNGNAEGFWSYTGAWGEGSSSGSYSYFEDCIFESNQKYAAFAFHTNTDFVNPCTHVFKNCQFIMNYTGDDTNGSFMIDDIQCGKPINVEFVGCVFTKFLFLQNHNSAVDFNEVNIVGHGNTPVYLNVYRPSVTNPKRIFAKFSDEVALVHNKYAAIDMGRPLRYANYPSNSIAIEQSDGAKVCGIALETIPQNGSGYMQYSGILALPTVGISGITMGDRVGVASYTVAKVTDGTYFARAIQNNIIKFD